ncbi:Topoisomerase 1-associated factor 1 [Ascosphaera acerosa]|nr:Topoisomerase 1-associated factor 1 [Ascosphaera acerosa]
MGGPDPDAGLGAGDQDHVPPEVRAYIYSLATALGGAGLSDDGRYVLGDDALGVLRDLKKWLQFYDERTNRMDVARCLAEADLVVRDLIPILVQGAERARQSKHWSRILIACSYSANTAVVELLVPLTWPLKSDEQMTVNHARHMPYLHRAQTIYKASLLDETAAPLLRVMIQLGLPSISVPAPDRSSRDEGIIKLLLYLFRNLLLIEPPSDEQAEDVQLHTLRSATIAAFQRQDVFALLLTMCSSIESSFAQHDTLILEVLFHLLKGIDPRNLYTSAQSRYRQGAGGETTAELAELMDVEVVKAQKGTLGAPTRHTRFGTMFWLKDKHNQESLQTISGQKVAQNATLALSAMDGGKLAGSSRRRGPPIRRKDLLDGSHRRDDFTHTRKLAGADAAHLVTFVEEFLDNCLGPFFKHLGKTISREAATVTDATLYQRYFLIAWFLQAERLRRRARAQRQREARASAPGSRRALLEEPVSWDVVNDVMNRSTCTSVKIRLRQAQDTGLRQDLVCVVRCMTQILLTAQEMLLSPLEEDREKAESVLDIIFCEADVQDRALKIIRDNDGQGLPYLDAVTEFAVVFVKMLEQRSKFDVQMYVQARRARKRKRKQKQVTRQTQAQPPRRPVSGEGEEEEAVEDGQADGAEQEGGEEEEDEEDSDSEAYAIEKPFDFAKYERKFYTQELVNLFVSFLAHHRDLDDEQLKRAHRLLYRVGFKLDQPMLLFRLDIVALLFELVQGHGLRLRRGAACAREWDELVRHLLRRLWRRLDADPAMFEQLLFDRNNVILD